MAIVLILIKASVLLAAGIAGARLLRSAPAATRHALWSVTFVALLALPALDGAVPALRVPVPSTWALMLPRPLPGAMPDLKPRPAPGNTEGTRPTLPAGDVRARHEQVAASPATSSPVSAPTSSMTPSIGTLAVLVWLAGALAAAGVLTLSLLRVRVLARTAADVTDPAWHDAAETIGARLAIRRRARVLVSGAIRTPMAGGVWRPLIFLPSEALSWTPEQRTIVLAHELSHIARRDPLRHLAARLAVGCYWFHPLAWIAAGQASLAREQACDEAVLALGIRPSDYARVLLDLAETLAPERQAAAALPMVERSLLETRLMAILEPRIRPSRLRQSFVPAAAAAAIALALAAARPAARSTDLRVPEAPQASREGTCWSSGSDRDDFSGYTNTDSRGNILERVGTNGGALIIQQRYNDTRVCMRAEGGSEGSRVQSPTSRDTPTSRAGRATRVIIETERGGSTAHLDIRRPAAGPEQTSWRVNGAERPFDATAQAWRDAVLAVLDQSWEISHLRGQESSLRGEISSLRGEESSLRGNISSLRGDISSLRGEQSSIRGEESSLRGEISTIQGHVSSLRGQISSERGSISSLEAARDDRNDTDRERLASQLKAHEAEIARIERQLRDYDEAAKIAAVERQIRALDADGKVAALEDDIRKFDEKGKTAAIEKQIEALNVEGKTAEIEKRIQALDVDRRSREIENRLGEALKKLEQAAAAIK